MPEAGKDSHSDYMRYRDYYLRRESSKEGLEKRAHRREARDLAIKIGMLTGAGDKRTVDHIKPLSHGGTNARSNLKVVSATENRRKYNNE